MRKATRKFKVGLVVIGSGVLFLGLVLFIVGSSLGSEFVTYNILFEESVKGMVIGSKVNFQGIPVGAVSDIRFEKGKTRVEISIDPEKAVVQEVTFARMDRLMVTGQVTVELEGYRVDLEALPVGGTIPPRKSAFDEFAQSLPEVITDVDDLLLALKELVERTTALLDEGNRKSVRAILQHLEKSSSSLAQHLDPLLSETRETVAELRPALRTMQSSFAKMGAVVDSDQFTGALKSVSDAMARVDRIEAEILNLVRDLRGVVGGSRRNWLGTLATARAALEEIKTLARNLRMAPSSLVFGRTENEIVIPAVPAGGKR